MWDRRQKPRLKFQLSLDVTSGHNFYTARTGDLSEGGLFIESDAAIAIGSVIHLNLSLDGQRIESSAQVVWQLRDAQGRPEGIGVELRDLSEASRQAIVAFMARRRPIVFGAAQPPPLPPPLPGPTLDRVPMPARQHA